MAEHEVGREIVVPQAPEQVWEAVVDDRRMSEWIGFQVDLEPWAGGRGRFEAPDGTVRHAVVVDVVPCRRLVFDWWPADLSTPPTTVEVTVAPAGPGFLPPTRIRVVEAVAGLRPQARAA